MEAVLLSLRDRGVRAAKLAVGDGGLGLWSALAEVYPETRAQRCWVHKTANVLDRLPKRVQGEAKTIICNLKLREVSTESAIDSTLIHMNALYDSKRYFLFCAFDINPRQSLRGLASLSINKRK